MAEIVSFSTADIELARLRLCSATTVTPLEHYRVNNKTIWVKRESEQHSGAFKFRGALNALRAEKPQSGVATYSTGNFARGLALAAEESGTSVTACVSELVPENKRDALRALGVTLHVEGRSQDEAEQICYQRAAEQGLTVIDPISNPNVVIGHGTIATEVLQQLPEADCLILPLSAGSLLGGVAFTAKTLKPGIRIVGVSAERNCVMHKSQQAGEPIECEELPSVADSLGGGIGRRSRLTFDLVKQYVDELVLVTEAQIKQAMRCLFNDRQWVVEGAAAVGIAAVQAFPHLIGKHTVVVITGKNIDAKIHSDLMKEGSDTPASPKARKASEI